VYETAAAAAWCSLLILLHLRPQFAQMLSEVVPALHEPCMHTLDMSLPVIGNVLAASDMLLISESRILKHFHYDLMQTLQLIGTILKTTGPSLQLPHLFHVLWRSILPHIE